jgi:hypothetical protein
MKRPKAKKNKVSSMILKTANLEKCIIIILI